MVQVRILGACALMLSAVAAVAQTALVPPSKKKDDAGLTKSQADLIGAVNTTAAIKQSTMQQTAAASLAAGDRLATRVTRKIADKAGVIGAVATGVDTIDAAVKGDNAKVMQNVRDIEGTLLVTAGCSATPSPFACEAAYEAGHAIGTGVSYIPKLIDEKNPTINEYLTDKVIFPAWESIGCPGMESEFGVDSRYCGGENSRAAQDAARDAARRRFENRSSSLEAQQRDRDAQQAAAAAQASTPANNANAGPDFLDALSGALDAYSDYQQQMSTPAPASAPASTNGCHPGHDEQAHPGGCHDYGGMQLR